MEETQAEYIKLKEKFEDERKTFKLLQDEHLSLRVCFFIIGGYQDFAVLNWLLAKPRQNNRWE